MDRIENTLSFDAQPLPGYLSSLKPNVAVRNKNGVFLVYRPPSTNIVATQFWGHIDMQAAEALRAFGTRQFVAGSRFHFFHDWQEVRGYDSAARSMLTAWSIECRASIRGVVVMTKSKLVAMGVATANLATSLLGVQMHSHTERKAFEKELRSALEC